MEKPAKKRAKSNPGVEENTLAILESFCSYDRSHVHDDRLAFLEAVRSSSVVSEKGSHPTKKMMEAVFGIMREERSLELIMFSFRLLCEIEKHFPRVYLVNGDGEQGSCTKPTELVVIEEAWSPFDAVSDGGFGHKPTTAKGVKEPITAADFHLLLINIVEGVDETESSETKLELLAKMILFQYLITVLEADFLPRNQAFLANSNWICLRESFLNKLLGSRTINFKGVVKDCFAGLCCPLTQMNHDSEPDGIRSSKLLDSSDVALSLSFPEVEKHTIQAVQKLLLMMMELDSSKRKADQNSLTTRVDSPRTPAIDIIVDELSYYKDMISQFLQAFDVPEMKLEIISQFLQKYTAKPSTRNRKSNTSDDALITSILKVFINRTSAKAIVKKLGAEAVQVLLAHTLQACMSIAKDKLLEIYDLKDDPGSTPLSHICKNVISAFTTLKESDEKMQILPFGKEAIFTAATILSTGS
ncbi:hypothetical protein vseg_008941 [Gypsophila vaccaria]